jgi:methylated-DNA-[protein]-cysteine S-methyltransferase
MSNPFVPATAGTTITDVIDSAVGPLRLTSDGNALTGLYFVNGKSGPGGDARPDPAWFGEVKAQLEAYFAGELTEFSLPLAPSGTAFQMAVWTELTRIPYGFTTSYGAVARAIGKSLVASRAVGLANGSNPISIIVPCHRVIGADGGLTGYGGGLDRKLTLLKLEGSAGLWLWRRLGSGLASSLGRGAHWLGGGLLIAVGGYTLLSRGGRPGADARVAGDGPGSDAGASARLGRLVLTGFALSLDNLAAGFALGAYHVEFWVAAAVIGVVSVGMSLAGLQVGARFASARFSELAAGTVLIAVGAAMAAGAL